MRCISAIPATMQNDNSGQTDDRITVSPATSVYKLPAALSFTGSSKCHYVKNLSLVINVSVNIML